MNVIFVKKLHNPLLADVTLYPRPLGVSHNGAVQTLAAPKCVEKWPNSLSHTHTHLQRLLAAGVCLLYPQRNGQRVGGCQLLPLDNQCLLKLLLRLGL